MNTPAIVSPIEAQTLDRIVEGLVGLRFGSLEIVVHDSKVVRITRSEKVRLDGASRQSPPQGSPQAADASLED